MGYRCRQPTTPQWGDPVSPYQPSGLCFQFGQNLYCSDSYELAKVSTYRREDYRVRPPRISLREVTIAYKQQVIGLVSEVKAASWNADQVMVGPLCAIVAGQTYRRTMGLSWQQGALSPVSSSVVTLKPANGGQGKTGQRE